MIYSELHKVVQGRIKLIDASIQWAVRIMKRIKPTSNCRRVTGTQGGRNGPASQKLGLQEISCSSTFLQFVWDFRIEIETVANQNCRIGMMVIQALLYMSLICSAVEGTHR